MQTNEMVINRDTLYLIIVVFSPNPAISTKCLRCMNTGYKLFINISFFMPYSFHRRTESEICFEKILIRYK